MIEKATDRQKLNQDSKKKEKKKGNYQDDTKCPMDRKTDIET